MQRERVAQQIGLVLLSAFVLAGAGGLFGNGPLSETTVDAGAVSLRFERFTRQTFRTHLEISAETPGPDGLVEIRVAREFLSDVDVLEVRPASALKRLDRDVAIFEVPSAAGNATLQLLYEPKRYGVLRTDIVVGAQPAAHLRQIVFF